MAPVLTASHEPQAIHRSEADPSAPLPHKSRGPNPGMTTRKMGNGVSSGSGGSPSSGTAVPRSGATTTTRSPQRALLANATDDEILGLVDAPESDGASDSQADEDVELLSRTRSRGLRAGATNIPSHRGANHLGRASENGVIPSPVPSEVRSNGGEGPAVDAPVEGELGDVAFPVPSEAEPEDLRAAFDANPELREAWQDANAYRESFATPEEARAATAQIADLDRLDALFFSRKPEDHAQLARTIATLDPEAFASLAQAN